MSSCPRYLLPRAYSGLRGRHFGAVEQVLKSCIRMWLGFLCKYCFHDVGAHWLERLTTTECEEREDWKSGLEKHV